MTSLLKDFAHDDSGATAIEYALIASLISVAIIAAVTTTGQKIGNTFDGISAVLR